MTDECQIRITTIRIHQRFVMNGELYTFLERKYIKKGKCYEDMNGLTFVIIAYNESKKRKDEIDANDDLFVYRLDGI